MNVIPVDYNAATPAGSLRLDFEDTQQALAAIHAHAGDWVWVSDREVLVGAQLETDPEYGLVAVPRWRTIVHLDDYREFDYPSLVRQLGQVLDYDRWNSHKATEVFRLIIVFNQIVPAHVQQERDVPTGEIFSVAANALKILGELPLALTLFNLALSERPHDPYLHLVYLIHLCVVNPVRAEEEAWSRLKDRETHAAILAGCISILSSTADQLTDADFAMAAPAILNSIDRFNHAPGRDRIRPAVLALVRVHHGLILLRLNRPTEAHAAFDQAYEINPNEPRFDAARHLTTFDDSARDLAARFRSNPPLTAA